jgi:hypothetical protein
VLDWPAFGDALWTVSDTLGIRPEWQLPVLALETGGTFDPAITNAGGCVGLNQFCPGTYPNYVHVPVSEYKQWLASQQLSGPILRYWQDAQRFGPIRSATRLMLAQLGPGLLEQTAQSSGVVFRAPSREYRANASVFDTDRKGFISVEDIANAMARASKLGAVQDALHRAYAMRPGERPTDPVLGEDFEHVTPPLLAKRTHPFLLAGAALALVAAAAYAASAVRG